MIYEIDVLPCSYSWAVTGNIVCEWNSTEQLVSHQLVQHSVVE